MIRRLVIGATTVELADEGAGQEPVVLLHGFTGAKESWSGLRRALSPVRRVIALDLPGHGGTTVAATEDHSIHRTSELVLAALDRLDIVGFDLVGYSMGGRLALYLALAAPRRIRRLVLESASAGLESENERDARRRADEDLACFVEREGTETFVDRWERQPLFASLARLGPRARDELRRQRLACSSAGLAASLRGMGTGTQPWLGERLRELAIPVLVIAGALDEKYAAIARQLAAALPAGRLAIVYGAGHVPHLERPEEFERVVVDFVTARTLPWEGEAPAESSLAKTGGDKFGEVAESSPFGGADAAMIPQRPPSRAPGNRLQRSKT